MSTTKDLTDTAPIELQFLIWGYCVTDRRTARDTVTRLNAASDICERQGPALDLSERWWDRTARDLKRIQVSDANGPIETPASWALSGVRHARP